MTIVHPAPALIDQPSVEHVPERGSESVCTEGDTVVGPSASAPPSAPASASASAPAAPSLLEAAISYTRRGWRVIPLQWRRVEADGTAVCSCWRRIDCGRNSCKHPVFKNWPEIASTDLDLVTKWWCAFPLGNIGIATGWQPDGTTYLIALDEDRDGALAELAAQHGEELPATWTQATGRGRHHIFTVAAELLYAVDAIRNRTRISDGLDVRAHGGLVVAAPSVSIAGAPYTITHDVPPAPIPSWLFWAIANKRSRSANVKMNASRPIEAELPLPLDVRIADGIERCKRHAPAVDGRGGDATTFELTLQLVRGLVLPTDTAFELLWQHYNGRCVGPWSETELRHKIDYAEHSVSVPWGYLLPPATNANVNAAAEANGPTMLSPSVHTLPPSLPPSFPRPQQLPPATSNTISLPTTSRPRTETREIATIQFCGRRRRNGDHALNLLVLDGTHVGAEIPWWLDWPANERSQNKWHHLAIALGLDEIRDTLRDTHGKRVLCELITKANGSVVPRRVFPLP